MADYQFSNLSENEQELLLQKNNKIRLVIGNGFDLNLGLKTSYSDYVNSSIFSNLLEHSNNLANFLYNSFKSKSPNWIDIEIELKKYSWINHVNFKNEFNSIKQNLIEYLDQINYNIDQSSPSFHLIKQLFTSNTDLKIYNFNYTNTFRIISESYNVLPSQNGIEIINIHGSIKTGNIIFGVEDNADIMKEHIFLKKPYSPFYHGNTISRELIEANEIIFFGHSLGETDHTYFQEYFYNATQNNGGYKRQKLTFYYFKDQGYDQLLMQLDILTRNALSKLRSNTALNSYDVSKIIKS